MNKNEKHQAHNHDRSERHEIKQILVEAAITPQREPDIDLTVERIASLLNRERAKTQLADHSFQPATNDD